MPLSSWRSKIVFFYNFQLGNYPLKSCVSSWGVEFDFASLTGWHSLVFPVEIGSLWDTEWLQTYWASPSLQIHSIVSWAGYVFNHVSLSSKQSPLFALKMFLLCRTNMNVFAHLEHKCANRLWRVWYSARKVKTVLKCFKCFFYTAGVISKGSNQTIIYTKG